MSEELLEEVQNEFPDFKDPGDRDMHTPIGSNKVYEVLIKESFGEASHSQQKGWSWDLFKCPPELSPRPVFDMSPWSPTVSDPFAYDTNVVSPSIILPNMRCGSFSQEHPTYQLLFSVASHV